MMRILLILVFLVAGSSLVIAQDSTPLIGGQAIELPSDLVAPVLNDGVERVLVIGDSMAGGLGAGMARMAAGDATIEVVNRFNESSAITRPDIYDWSAALPKIMDGKNFTTVVVLIGLNDRQDIRTADGRLSFNTPEWTKAYQANVDAIADTLKAQNVKVFWLSEPPMGDAAYDADMKLVSSLQRERVVAKGAIFVDTRTPLLNSDGTYMDFGPDDTGEMKKLRQRDGVTFLKQGNNKFGQIVLAAIKAGGEGQMPAVTAPADDTAAPVAVNATPMFGQMDANGQDVLHNSGDVVASAAIATAQPAGVDTGPLKASSQSAIKLFETGEPTIAPVGRFDDFSYVAPAQP
jgi:uncharacterized protein